jgi:hypothetical protein
MKKILILCLGIFLTLSIFGKNREFNPIVRDAMITNFILDELRADGYTVLPEVVVVAYRNDQDTIHKDFRHQRGPAFLNDTLKKEFQRSEFRGRPEFGKRPEVKGRPEFGRNYRNMRGREMKRENMRKMDCPCLQKQIDPIKPPVA